MTAEAKPVDLSLLITNPDARFHETVIGDDEPVTVEYYNHPPAIYGDGSVDPAYAEVHSVYLNGVDVIDDLDESETEQLRAEIERGE